MLGETFARTSAAAMVWIALALVSYATQPPAKAANQLEANTTQLAQRLMNALFPELGGPAFTAAFEVEARVDQSWVSPNPLFLAVQKTANGDGSKQTVLEARMLFLGGDYNSASFTGEHVNTAALTRIESAANSAHSWTLDDVRQALTALNARFGPDEEAALASSLDIDRWSGAFGPISVSEVRFVWRMPLQDDQFIPPAWIVRLTGTGALGKHQCYSVMIEPVHGRVISVRGHDCQI